MTSHQTPRLHHSSSTLDAAPGDALVVPVFTGEIESALATLDSSASARAGAAHARGEFTAKPCQLFHTPLDHGGSRVRQLILVGGGERVSITPERLRRMAASAALLARQQRLAHLAWVAGSTDAALVQAAVEGITAANFDAGHYKSREVDRFFLEEVTIVSPQDAQVAEAAERGRLVGEAMNGARRLVNEPGNRLTPRMFIEQAAKLAQVPGIAAEVLDEQRMAELEMGLLLGVAAGSVEPPRLLVLRYEPADAPASPVLCFVGKGITFDTGGLSLKPADGMERMKDDMAGGAAVVAALRAIALMKVPLRMLVVVPSTENMPSGRALKPGDVLRGASGLTVEVNNTDAEGRLILGDGLWYAQQLGATHLVDVATLTGACVVALGKTTTGLFAKPDEWLAAVRDAAERAGERVWPMPLFDEYREALKSEIADMINSPGRAAGAVTAAMFLKEFAGDLAWAHLDIAGPAWADENKPWMPKGATGAMVPTLVELARQLAQKHSTAVV